MNKKNEPSKDQIIANLLSGRASYRTIQSILRTGNLRISRVASQLSQNKTITSAKMGRPWKIISEVYQTIEEETLKEPKIGGSSLSHLEMNCILISKVLEEDLF